MKDQKAIKETMPFTITTDRIKYLGINARETTEASTLNTRKSLSLWYSVYVLALKALTLTAL